MRAVFGEAWLTGRDGVTRTLTSNSVVGSPKRNAGAMSEAARYARADGSARRPSNHSGGDG